MQGLDISVCYLSGEMERAAADTCIPSMHCFISFLWQITPQPVVCTSVNTRPLEIQRLSFERDTSLCWVVLEQLSVSVPWCQCITSTNCTVSLQTHFTLCTSQKCRVFSPAQVCHVDAFNTTKKSFYHEINRELQGQSHMWSSGRCDQRILRDGHAGTQARKSCVRKWCRVWSVFTLCIFVRHNLLLMRHKKVL